MQFSHMAGLKEIPPMGRNLMKNTKAMTLVLTLLITSCLLYTSPSPRDAHESRMPSSA